jgi:hypothetical protein
MSESFAMSFFFVYFGKRFDATKREQRVVQVQCDQCGCEFFYELARVGIGAASAPYYLGQGSAARRAMKYAEVDLERRLNREADLVPCPECNWINNELVRKYRNGRYRGGGKAALLIVILGTIMALLVAWFISRGPAADQAAVPYVLVGGPILSVATAAISLLKRKLLRSLIRPNRRFPLFPELPPGSPPALIRDTASSKLSVAHPEEVDLRRPR